MKPSLFALYPDGRAEVHLFASPVERDRLYSLMRFYGGPDRLARSERASLDDIIRHAEDLWCADRVQVIQHTEENQS